MPMSGPAYMHTSIATPGLTANQHTGNRRDHLRMVECPDALIIFPSWCSSDYSLSHIIQHVNYTQVPKIDSIKYIKKSIKYRNLKKNDQLSMIAAIVYDIKHC